MRSPGRGTGEQGQASVELALTLPVLALLALALVQVGLVVRDELLVLHAARDGVREAAVTADRRAVAEAVREATALDPDRVAVSVGRRGGVGDAVEVTVRYRSPTRVPLVGRLVGDVALRATSVMRVET